MMIVSILSCKITKKNDSMGTDSAKKTKKSKIQTDDFSILEKMLIFADDNPSRLERFLDENYTKITIF